MINLCLKRNELFKELKRIVAELHIILYPDHAKTERIIKVFESISVCDKHTVYIERLATHC